MDLGGLTRLKVLDLKGSEVTDACVVHPRRLGNPQQLNVEATMITDTRVEDIQKALPNRKIRH